VWIHGYTIPGKHHAGEEFGNRRGRAHRTLQFEVQTFVGFGADVEGRFMLTDIVVTSSDNDHQLKKQRVNMASGTGESWLFVRYEYVRQRWPLFYGLDSPDDSHPKRMQMGGPEQLPLKP
jgi:hypothetical protein